MKKTTLLFLSVFFLVFAVASTGFATPVIYNDSVAAGTSSFDSIITAAGGTVMTDTLANLTQGTSWDRGDYTITADDGLTRFIDTNYYGYGANGLYLSGEAIGINPTGTTLSGLTFVFDTPINAFGLEVGDWATCCYPSGLYIAFDGGSDNLVAMANTYTDNPGVPADDGYINFVAAIDDSATFTTITFYGDGVGEYLVAGGTIRYATVEEGSVTEIVEGVPEPGTMFLVGGALMGLAGLRRRTKR